MPEASDLRQLVRQVVSQVLEIPIDQLDDDADFEQDLGCESLQRLEVMVQLERRLGIRFADGEASKMTSVEAVLDLTRGHVASISSA